MFELRYPAGGTYTASWTTAASPSLAGTSLEENTGILAQTMADAATQVADRVSIAFTRYTYTFESLTKAERAALIAFAALVGGAAFDLKDGATDCGMVTSYTPVHFAVEGFKRTWSPRAGQKFATTIVLQDAAA